MVFKEPAIKSFVHFAKDIFSEKEKSKYSELYLIKGDSYKNKKYPKEISNFIDNYSLENDDIVCKTISNNIKKQKTIIIYNKKYNNNLIEFGSLVSAKVDNGNWSLYSNLNNKQELSFALGWGLNQYKFNNLKIMKRLKISKGNSTESLVSIISGIFYGKELINIPSSDMGPESLVKSFINFANYYGLKTNIFRDNIIREEFPLIYAVGKGSVQSPRLLEMNFNENKKKYPLVILIGKGVCFDTGGHNLKPSQYMRNMKKDMGGAASVLSLTNAIVRNNLKVNLKVLIPTVDNDIGPNSMRPGDVYNSKAGIKVEIGNTDAEGRLILADTLSYAESFKPFLLIDFATLTGAARVALGPDLPAYFTPSNDLSDMIDKISFKEQDPLWRLPLWSRYNSWLKSEVADINNISKGSFAGSITAALFLYKFVNTVNWVHIDTYAWSDSNSPGHSAGGDILAVRSIFKFIKKFIS